MKTHKNQERVNRHQRPISRNFRIPSLKNTQMTKKILIVEDNIDLIHVLGLALELLGHEVIRVTNGNQAVDTAAAQLPDLIILNIMLPVMNGTEAARMIRQNPKTHSIPILAMTGGASVKDQKECLQNGCNDYISKPFTPKELVARIEKLLVISQ